MSIFFPEVQHTSYLILHSEEEKHLNKLVNSSSKVSRSVSSKATETTHFNKNLLTAERGVQEKDYVIKQNNHT